MDGLEDAQKLARESEADGVMKITHIETLLAPEQAVVRIYTDSGLEGIGQTGCYGARVTTEVLHSIVAPHFLGHNPWDIQALVGECLKATYKFSGTFLYRALCGVDTAIYDLLGKATSQPVYRLLGGAFRSKIPVYASSMSRQTLPEQEAELLRNAVEKNGFRCVKFKIGGRMSKDADAFPGRTERLIPLVRQALGSDVDISADGNGSYSVHKAINIGRLLEQYNYFHFEEPCPYREIENTAQVAAALDIPVAGGEQDNMIEHFQRMIRTRAVDIVQPDIGYVGGITRARKVAEMAEVAGIPCTPHCANHSLLQVFAVHFAAAMPSCYQYQEWRITDDKLWSQEIYQPLVKVIDGEVAVPTGPGWGVHLDEGYINKAEIQSSSL